MIRHQLVAILLAAATPLAAQEGAQVRLAGRIPATALAAVDSTLREAVADGLPVEPLIQKALEGGAKGVASDRIVGAVRAALAQLRSARTLARVAGDSRPADQAEIRAVAAALSRGVSPQLAGRLTAALPGEPLGPALHAVADLVGHGFGEAAAVDLIVQAAHEGLRGLRLLDVAAAAVQELQRGRTHEVALKRVRTLLPNVPLPPRPGPAAVSTARRVQQPVARP